jgi:hypothetical protein
MTKEIDPKTVDLLHQNMKCRLSDIVGEYLDDDNYSGLTFFNDLNDVIKEWEEHLKKKQYKASGVLSLINGPSNTLTGDFGYPDRSPYRSIINSNYTEEELNAMCDKAASDQEKQQCQEYNLREAEYYNKRFQLDVQANSPYKDELNMAPKSILSENVGKKDWDNFWEHK